VWDLLQLKSLPNKIADAGQNSLFKAEEQAKGWNKTHVKAFWTLED